MLAEHMAMVFPEDGPPAPWDEKWEYRCSSMECYLRLHAMPAFKSSEEWVNWVRLKKAARGELPSTFMLPEVAARKLRSLEEASAVHEDDQLWLRVPPVTTLAQLLRCPGHVVPGAMVSLHFYPRNGAPHAAFLKKHGKRITDLDLTKIPPPPPPPPQGSLPLPSPPTPPP
jgi:hypothetical protein